MAGRLERYQVEPDRNPRDIRKLSPEDAKAFPRAKKVEDAPNKARQTPGDQRISRMQAGTKGKAKAGDEGE